MKETVKAFILLITILMSISALPACSGEIADTQAVESTSAEKSAETVIEEIDRSGIDDLPELDYEGYEFRVRSVTFDPQSYLTLFDIDEQNGDVVQDSIYQRNRKIEERLNVKFNASEASYSDNYKTLNSTAMSGDDAYDLIQCINREAFAAALNGYILTTIGRMNLTRAMEGDYGVVPFPKYDENQDRYYNRVVDGWLHVAPVTCGNPERTSAVMEALAYETSVTVIPSYYEKAVQHKMLRDEESVKMLDLIRSTRMMDLGDVPWMDNIRMIYNNAVTKNQLTIASITESKLEAVQKVIDEAVEAASNLK